jgi:hypothetical protein
VRRDVPLVALLPVEAAVAEGDETTFAVPREKLRFFDAESGRVASLN